MSGVWSGVGQWVYFIVCSMRRRGVSRMSVAYTLLDLATFITADSDRLRITALLQPTS